MKRFQKLQNVVHTWRYKTYMYKSFTQMYFIFLLAIGELMFLVETKPYAVLECKNTQRKYLADIYLWQFHTYYVCVLEEEHVRINGANVCITKYLGPTITVLILT